MTGRDGHCHNHQLVRIISRSAPARVFLTLSALGLSVAFASAQSGSRSWFTDGAAAAGLDFVHFNGMSGEYYSAEIMGPGGALLDFDNDGDLDVYLVQGRMLGPGKTLADALFPPPSGTGPEAGDRLYRNDLQVQANGTRTLRFTDVTAGSGLGIRGYGMGVATGDVDNDGWIDIYRTGLGANHLFRNNGDGTFADLTARAGADDPRWSVSASFVDYDRDGWLDLYVGNYVDPRLEDRIECFNRTGEKDYCGPQRYVPAPDRLLRNRGDGTFADVTAAALRGGEYGPALGVVAADLDGDGWQDLYVANDGEPNQLWLNQRDGTFLDGSWLAGVAVNRDGNAEGSMGVDAGDFDGDGDDDLFMTHIATETNTLYINDGGLFEDRTARAGLGPPSLPYTGFGTAWFDFDNDGWLDLLIANGEIRTQEALVRANDPFPLHQRNQLFRNLGNGRFEEVGDAAGSMFRVSEVSRGAAFGDVDNDGDTDVLLTNNNGPVRLLINRIGDRNPWVGLRLVGASGRRDMLGARVAVFRGGGAVLWRRARTDGSYVSANDPRVLFGLGETASVDRVRVVWPGGRAEEWAGVGANRWTTLIEGTGRSVE